MSNESYIIHIAENGYVITPYSSYVDTVSTKSVPAHIALVGTLEETLNAVRVSQKITDLVINMPPAPAPGPAPQAQRASIRDHAIKMSWTSIMSDKKSWGL